MIKEHVNHQSGIEIVSKVKIIVDRIIPNLFWDLIYNALRSYPCQASRQEVQNDRINDF